MCEIPKKIENKEERIEYNLKNAKILLVDDEYLIREFYNFLFCKNGAKVTLVEDGSEAMQAVEENNGEFDLIILDKSLPGEDGEEVAKKIKKMHDIPMIMHSGNIGILSEESKQNFEYLLPKPICFKNALRAICLTIQKYKEVKTDGHENAKTNDQNISAM